MKSKLFIMALLFIVNATAFASGIVYDPSNWIQNSITAAKETKSVLNQAAMIHNELNSINYQVKNLHGFNNVLWNSTSSTLSKLANVVGQGQSLSYNMQNLNQAFQSRFPGYKPSQNYQQGYKTWSQTALDTLRGTLDSASMQAQDFTQEQASINQLRGMAKTEQGRQQALEVGNQISAETVNQMQNLRQLVINQTNAQNAYMAYKVQKDQAKQNAVSKYIGNINDNYPSYNNRAGFGVLPDFHQ